MKNGRTTRMIQHSIKTAIIKKLSVVILFNNFQEISYAKRLFNSIYYEYNICKRNTCCNIGDNHVISFKNTITIDKCINYYQNTLYYIDHNFYDEFVGLIAKYNFHNFKAYSLSSGNTKLRIEDEIEKHILFTKLKIWLG